MYFDPIAPCCDGDQCAASLGNGRDAAIVKAVVRGERAIEELRATDLWFDARLGTGDPASHTLSAADLAEGIANLKNDPVALEELANAIVAVSERLSFEGEHSDYLFSRVWELALGHPLADSTIRLAQAVRNRFCGTETAGPLAITR